MLSNGGGGSCEAVIKHHHEHLLLSDWRAGDTHTDTGEREIERQTSAIENCVFVAITTRAQSFHSFIIIIIIGCDGDGAWRIQFDCNLCGTFDGNREN